ncbi:AAA family ATPase [Arthrobacter sp. TB 26]|uniref:AAA family ATPase n=1 Tax=Arthrobacter sp. TB 26 TaxID=494420 RepID=UPI00046298BE|nr:AAA family ATPase [Arthrobacter sp. TB 26]
MPVLLIASQKGGTGKTTTTINVAAELARRGRDVLIVDCDKSVQSASTWASDRAQDESLPRVHAIQKTGNVREALKDLGARYDYVIVDAPGHDSQEMRTAMTVADLMLIPVRPSQFDLDTIPGMVELIETAKDMNPKLKVAALLTQVPTYSSATEEDEARDFLRDYPQIPRIDAALKIRKAYRDSIPFGKGVIEISNGSAKAEVQVLVKEIEEWL